MVASVIFVLFPSRQGWGGGWTLKIITCPEVIPVHPSRVTINYPFSWRATDAITGDLCDWNRTLNEKPAPPPPPTITRSNIVLAAA